MRAPQTLTLHDMNRDFAPILAAFPLSFMDPDNGMPTIRVSIMDGQADPIIFVVEEDSVSIDPLNDKLGEDIVFNAAMMLSMASAMKKVKPFADAWNKSQTGAAFHGF